MSYLHYTEAIAEAERNKEILVTLDEVLIVNQGTRSAIALHIVGEPDYWTKDEPKGYCVELVRPSWLYGAEGHLHKLRWVGRVEELTDEELDAMSEEDPYWDLIPEHGNHLWALPKLSNGGKPWQRCEIPWFDSFRSVST